MSATSPIGSDPVPEACAALMRMSADYDALSATLGRAAEPNRWRARVTATYGVAGTLESDHLYVALKDWVAVGPRANATLPIVRFGTLTVELEFAATDDGFAPVTVTVSWREDGYPTTGERLPADVAGVIEVASAAALDERAQLLQALAHPTSR